MVLLAEKSGLSRIKSVKSFTGLDSINTFSALLDLEETIEEINLYTATFKDDQFFEYIDDSGRLIHHLDQLILSIAPFSYDLVADKLQSDLNTIRDYVSSIQDDRILFNTIISGSEKNQTLYAVKNKDRSTVSSINQDIPEFEEPQIEEPDSLDEIKTLYSSPHQNMDIPETGKKEMVEIESRKNHTKKRKVTNQKEILFSVKEEYCRTQREDTISKRNSIVQGLLDIYHRKEHGYRVMLGLFRGLDIYRRMSLLGDSFDKKAYMDKIMFYCTRYKEADLVEQLFETVPALSKKDIKVHLVNCLKILNNHIDKYRFDIKFKNKLDYRSGFNDRYQKRVRWFYFPENRIKKRNRSDLFTVRSVTADTAEQKTSKRADLISLLSSRDIDLCNKLLKSLVNSYYSQYDTMHGMISLFTIIENHESSIQTAKSSNNTVFSQAFTKKCCKTQKNGVNILDRMIYQNPRLNPSEIRSLLPVCIRIMKAKIDQGYSRTLQKDPALANSFNPRKKYYKVYNRNIFRIYRRA
jgi:hypothetical protein